MATYVLLPMITEAVKLLVDFIGKEKSVSKKQDDGLHGRVPTQYNLFDVGIGFLEASALDGTNVDEAFRRCARQILTKVELGHNRQ